MEHKSSVYRGGRNQTHRVDIDRYSREGRLRNQLCRTVESNRCWHGQEPSICRGMEIYPVKEPFELYR